MAGHAGLSPSCARGRRGPGWRTLLALAAAVLLLHALTLDWLAGALQYSTVLRPTVDPMFTRLLRPQAPPPLPAAAPVAQPAEPPRDRDAFAAALRRPEAAASAPAARAAASAARRPRAATPVPAAQEPVQQDEAPVAQAAPEAVVAAAQPADPPADTPQQAASAPPPAASAPPVALAQAAPASATATATASAPAADGEAQQASAALDSWPTDTRLTYRLSGQFRSGELYGDARVQWQREGSAYQVQVTVDVTLWAHLVMTSQGEVTPAGLMPRAFEETRRGKSRAVRLDRGTLLLDNGRVLPRPPGVQDTASQFVELSHRFATGRAALREGEAVSFWMARPGGLDFWTYDVVGRELLRTPQLGAVEAFHLRPRPIANPRGNITAEMWFAPSLQYLPVRIRVSMGEAAHVDLLVERIEQR